ncbi:MAG TPA: flagellar basal body rod protein FlgC [Alphaproteobacteria bacterium]|nr:flagellar basal body rod protein FlgC [Alphaproteobacteria bacterium]
MDDLTLSKKIAASGMKAQSQRLRVISENLANADSLAKTPGGQPYRRKTVTFRNELDRATGAELVKVGRVSRDRGQLERKYDPTHEAAGADGYVLLPNVNPLVETMDMKEAQRTYEANLNVISVSKEMMSKTLDLIR